MKLILVPFIREDGDNEFMNTIANKLTEKVCCSGYCFHLKLVYVWPIVHRNALHRDT